MKNKTPRLSVVSADTIAYFAIVTFMTETGPKTFAETVHLDPKMADMDRCRAVFSAIPGFPGRQAVTFCSVEPNRLSEVAEEYEAFVFSIYVAKGGGVKYSSNRVTNSDSAPEENIQSQMATWTDHHSDGMTRELLYSESVSSAHYGIVAVLGFSIVFSKID
ncbi:hypothetical protein GCM10010402_60300 [Actinomadura luteofluorescens]|uniref:hypothetical protein n=1 Tax=Actinomadura luteofluorescens TaxID=46163 RepID=UPI002164889C|nr:hypothetical protein [Actinomadura glauciflava]MCR3743510.1 hypothetical protein [Actinomadura glauciflava]